MVEGNAKSATMISGRLALSAMDVASSDVEHVPAQTEKWPGMFQETNVTLMTDLSQLNWLLM